MLFIMLPSRRKLCYTKSRMQENKFSRQGLTYEGVDESKRIMEIGELAGMRKADLDKVEAFISRQDDKYRASFGRRVTPHPRQYVFFGTTNSEKSHLRDVTGNRRFWTVKKPGIGARHPWELDKETIYQLWAEALYYEKHGEKLYLENDLEREAQLEQCDAMEQDDREGLMQAYLDTLLPESWEQMDVYHRQDYIRDPSDPTHPAGTVRRMAVSNMEYGRNVSESEGKI